MSYIVNPRQLSLPMCFLAMDRQHSTQPIAMRNLFDAYVQAYQGRYAFYKDMLPYEEIIHSESNANSDLARKYLSSIILPGIGSNRYAAEAAQPFFDVFARVSIAFNPTSAPYADMHIPFADTSIPSIYTPMVMEEKSINECSGYTLSTFFYLLCALQMGTIRGTLSYGHCSEQLGWLAQVPVQAETILDDVYDLAWFSKQNALRDKILFTGESIGYVLAMEAERMMQPIMPCNALPTDQACLTLRRKEYSLLVIFTFTITDVDRAVSLLKQAKKKQVSSVAVTTHAYRHVLKPHADACFIIPPTPPIAVPILGILPIQVFAYHTALSKGLDTRWLPQ